MHELLAIREVYQVYQDFWQTILSSDYTDGKLLKNFIEIAMQLWKTQHWKPPLHKH